MSNRILIFIILVRHGINPFKAMGEILYVMNERLTDKEKLFFIRSAKAGFVKVVLQERLELRGDK